MDVLTLNSMPTARYKNQFFVNVSGGLNNTILLDKDKIFFITEIHCTSETVAWSINYESFNTDSRCNLVTFDSTGDWYARPGNELAISTLRSAIGMKYIRGFFIINKRNY